MTLDRLKRGMFRSLGTAIVFGILCHGPRAGAQVNVEGLRKSVAASGIGATANVSLASFQGNTQGLSLGTATFVGGAAGPHLAFLNGTGRYARFGGKETVSRFGGHARYNYRACPWLSWEALMQLESDSYRRLKLRSLLGSGLRTQLLEGSIVSAYAGVTYLLEHNELSAELQSVRPDVVHRMGTYVTALGDLPQAGAVLSSTLYVQPRFDVVSDVRVLWESSLSFDLAPSLTAGIHAKYRFESPVLAGLKHSDFAITNTLGIKL